MRRRMMLVPALVVGVAAAPAFAVSVDHRTRLLSTTATGAPLAQPVTGAALAGNGAVVVFTTTAPDAVPGDRNGAIADVVREDVKGGQRALVSEGYDGGGANGSSGSPSISGNGLVVAFSSAASNIEPGDDNHADDVFARARGQAAELVSVAADGGPANGPSSQPDISADGRIVAFTSSASNLVAGDTNGRPDVFIRDLARHSTRRVSVSPSGGQANGASSAPAINADGSAIAFESGATNLVAGDTNGVDDVFVHDTRGRTERVSVASDGTQQDQAVASPFRAAPDISADGRRVVFDSDATTLAPGDTNQRTDVFLRDRLHGRTTLVSASSLNVEGNNDSITPRITPNGRFVTFQSFASNLVPKDGPREDLFVRDLRGATTALITATDSGARRQPEPVKQLLQTAQIADDARSALFISASSNIQAPQAPAPPSRELFLRRLDAPTAKVVSPPVRRGGVVRLVVGADDPVATRFLCRVDEAVAFACGPRIAVQQRAGKLLRIRAGGPGMLWSPAIRVPLG